MTQKQRHRLWYLTAFFLGVVGVVILVTVAFKENMLYFMTPSEVLAHHHYNRQLRLGGLVEKNSVIKEVASLTTRFVITDKTTTIPVSYIGIVPDLFREGQGVIVEGKLQEDGHFKADLLLAKHDENYMPPDIAAKIK